MVKVFNNVYVKNFPADWTEDKIRELFGKFGNIISCIVIETVKGESKLKFAFVCYGPPTDNESRTYGYDCATKAVEGLNGHVIDETHTLYCKPALSKDDRAKEKAKEMMRYKNSKKRCNLYVKNFPP